MAATTATIPADYYDAARRNGLKEIYTVKGEGVPHFDREYALNVVAEGDISKLETHPVSAAPK